MAKSFSVIGGFQKTTKRNQKSDEDYYDKNSKKKDRNKRKQLKNNTQIHQDKSENLDEDLYYDSFDDDEYYD